jgi:hypothetical protein
MGDEEDKETARSIAKAQGLQFHCIPTERCGAINVYVQGDLEPVQKSFNPLGINIRILKYSDLEITLISFLIVSLSCLTKMCFLK